MQFDDILKQIGEFGLYQKRLYFLLCLPAGTLASLLVLNVFLLGVPAHRCQIPGYDNDTYAVQNSEHRQLINVTIPVDGAGKVDKCHVMIEQDGGGYVKEKCTQWVYSDEVYTSTFAQKLNMVCDDAIQIPNAQMIFFFGVLFGSMFYGQISDIIGRRKTMYLCLLVLLGSSVGLIGMTEYIGFCVLMFIMGGGTLGLYMTLYVIGMELVGPAKRLWTGNVIQLFLTTGEIYLVLMVYLIREWRYFTLAVALPCCLFLPYYWLVPESCRWLLNKNRKKEAIEILTKVAKVNDKQFDPKLLDNLPPPSKEKRVWHLFSSKVLAIRTSILFLNWFVCSMSYYGVVMNIGNLGGDFYLNFVLITAVEYPGKAISILLLDRIGRKRLHIGFLFFGAAACIGTIWPILDGSDALHPVLIAFAMIGKMCVTGAFGTSYVLSAELYPTVCRNAGMGASSAVARVGSMIAPYIAKSADLIDSENGQAIPLTVFGVFMLIACFFTLFLPETLNRPLPESLEDVKNYGKKQKVTEVYSVPMTEDLPPPEYRPKEVVTPFPLNGFDEYIHEDMGTPLPQLNGFDNHAIDTDKL